jgi:hypothetical protein
MKRFAFAIILVVPFCLQSSVGHQTNFTIQENCLSKFHGNQEAHQKQVGILSVKRTGSSLTTAILSQLTGRVCMWSIQGSNWARAVPLNRGNSHVNKAAFPVLGSHFLSDFRPFKGQFILTLRDYKELFSRKGFLEYNKQDISTYYAFLNYYDAYKGKKFLVRYEELKNNHSQLIQKLATFLDSDPKRTRSLLKNYSNFQARVFKSYTIFPGGTKNSIQKHKTHFSSIPKVKLNALEKEMKSANPRLYNKYLQQYTLTKAGDTL